MKTFFITGVSTGIGRLMVETFVGQGHTVIGSVRKQADADTLLASTQKLSGRYVPVIFDVQDQEQMQKSLEELFARESGLNTVDVLINNAGIVKIGPILEVDMEVWRKQFEVNVFGCVALVKMLFPRIRKQGGIIINIGSIAGKLAFPFWGPYCASKHALEAMTMSLRMELKPFGIGVFVVGPGAVKTPIWDKADSEIMETKYDQYKRSLRRLQKFMSAASRGAIESEKVIEVISDIVFNGSPFARHTPVKNYAVNYLIPKLMPMVIREKFMLRMAKLN